MWLLLKAVAFFFFCVAEPYFCVLFVHIVPCCGPADGASPGTSRFEAVVLCVSTCSLTANHVLSWLGVQG